MIKGFGIYLRLCLLLVFVCWSFVCPGVGVPDVGAAPVVSGVSGSAAHNGVITLQGQGFGVKTAAPPTVWDNCSHGEALSARWSGGWPNNSGANYNLNYRASQRGISLPHSYATKYLCGAHYPGSGYNSGYNVMVWKNKTKPAFPAYSYWSYYSRFDNSYPISGNDNCKLYDYSCGSEPYAMNSAINNNWYIEFVGGVPSPPSLPQWHLNDDTYGYSGYCLYNSGSPNYVDRAAHSWWWNSGVNPIAGSWTKVELEIKWTDQPDGYIKVWENGVQKMNYVGETDHQWIGTSRNESIGGYARISNNSNAWRYFADIYYDQSLNRIIIGNDSIYSKCTIREVQIPTFWSDTSITATVNQGVFPNGQTGYIFVVDTAGVASSLGYPIVFGGSGQTVPGAPNRLRTDTQ